MMSKRHVYPKPLSSAAVGRMPLLEVCFLARWPSVLALRLPSWLEWNGLLEVLGFRVSGLESGF